MLTLFATILALSGGVSLYLTSPNQRWLARSLAWRRAGWFGLVLLALSLALFLQVAGSASSVFILVTLLMALWSLPPLVIAWLRFKKDGQR